MAPRPFHLLLVLPLLQTATSGRPQAECAVGQGQELALALAYATNATGHRRVEARLEQPLDDGAWEMEVRVEVAASGCGPGGAPRRSLALTLHGPPAGALLAPSLRHIPASSPSPLSLPSLSPSPSPSPAPSSAPPGYTTVSGLGHYRAPPQALDAMSARQLCREEGGALAVPTTRREVEQLLTRFPRNATGAVHTEYIWHGASDIEKEGTFATDDGVPLKDTGFAAFYPGQPSGKSAENCLALADDRSLHDWRCSVKLSFVCKVPLVLPAKHLLQPSPAHSPAPPGYVTLPGLGHYRAPTTALNWMDARKLCRIEGGALAAPTSRREVEELLSRFSRNATDRLYSNIIWLGASDIGQEGKFVTDDGVPIEDTGFSDFAPAEPTGGKAQNCIALGEDRLLYDWNCSIKVSFVCKVPL